VAAFTNEVFRLHRTEDIIIGTEENIEHALSSIGKEVDRSRGDAHLGLTTITFRDGPDRQPFERYSGHVDVLLCTAASGRTAAFARTRRG